LHWFWGYSGLLSTSGTVKTGNFCRWTEHIFHCEIDPNLCRQGFGFLYGW
jgi:hypothetical protein